MSSRYGLDEASDLASNEPWYTQLLGIEPALGAATGPLRQIVFPRGSNSDGGRATRVVTKSTMTFLFTDIEGSTRQWEESPAMHDRVDQHFAALYAAVEMTGGEVFATMGDGIAAAFTSAEAAVRAAISGQQEMPSTGLGVRMGIHTGEVRRIGRGLPRQDRQPSGPHHGREQRWADPLVGRVRCARAVRAIAGGTDRSRRSSTRDLTDPERLWQVGHPGLHHRFPAVRGVDAGSRRSRTDGMKPDPSVLSRPIGSPFPRPLSGRNCR